MTDLELLARILKCEAGGEGVTGMEAVATVIMNRVRASSGEYGRYNTVRDVIFAPGQFDCAREFFGGSYNPQNIYNIPADPVNYDIAQWAIDGGILPATGSALWYFNPFSSVCRQQFPNPSGQFSVRIGDHCFYVPTAAYALT